MSRPRTIPDTAIFSAILRLIAEGGEKSVAFSSVAAATGLSAPSLVQRYGALPDMLHAALAGEWARIDAATSLALEEVAAAAKGPQAILKALSPPPSAALLAATVRDPQLRDRARLWRQRVESALAPHFDSEDAAAILFAAWQGQSHWEPMGDKGFKMKDAIKRLA